MCLTTNVQSLNYLLSSSGFLNFSVAVRLVLCVKEYVWPLPALGSTEVKTSRIEISLVGGYLNDIHFSRKLVP